MATSPPVPQPATRNITWSWQSAGSRQFVTVYWLVTWNAFWIPSCQFLHICKVNMRFFVLFFLNHKGEKSCRFSCYLGVIWFSCLTYWPFPALPIEAIFQWKHNFPICLFRIGWDKYSCEVHKLLYFHIPKNSLTSLSPPSRNYFSSEFSDIASMFYLPFFFFFP